VTAKELNEKMVKAGTVLHGNRVALAREKTVTQTKGGLFIPDSAQRDNQYAAVVLIGNGPEVQALGLNIGDRLYIPKYRPVDIKQRVGNETYWLGIMHFTEVYLSYPDGGQPLEIGEPEKVDTNA